MNTYYAGSGGGCFGAKSTVIVVDSRGDDSCRQVIDVRAGEIVRVSQGTAVVKCVVQIVRDPSKKTGAPYGRLANYAETSSAF